MAISDSTLSVDVYNTIRTLLLTPSAPYITNSTSSATTSAGVNVSYNDKAPTKPQIIINPATYSESEYRFDNNKVGKGRKLINVTVDCYAGNTLGTDQLSDQILSRISDYKFEGMELVGVITDQAFVNPNVTKYQLKSITLTFDRS